MRNTAKAAQYLFSLIEAMEILSCCFQLLWLRRLFKKWFLFNEVEEFSADEIDDDSDGDEEEQEDGNGDGDDSPPQYSNIETTCFPGKKIKQKQENRTVKRTCEIDLISQSNSEPCSSYPSKRKVK